LTTVDELRRLVTSARRKLGGDDSNSDGDA